MERVCRRIGGGCVVRMGVWRGCVVRMKEGCVVRTGGGCVMRVVVIMGCGRERMGVVKRGCSEKGCVSCDEVCSAFFFLNLALSSAQLKASTMYSLLGELGTVLR